MRLREGLAFGLIVIGCALAPATVMASPGDLDPAFGIGGFAVQPGFGDSDITGYNGTFSSFRAIGVQPDGGTVIAGDVEYSDCYPNGCFPIGSSGTQIARVGATGDLDPSFGTGGFIRPFDSADPAVEFQAAAVSPDGGILAIGRSSDGTAIEVVRFGPQGQVDEGFGNAGRSTIDLPGSLVASRALTTTGDDGSLTIAVAGAQPSGPRSITLIKVLPNGGLDSSFGTGGFATDGSDSRFETLDLDATGRIVVSYAAFDEDATHILRYRQDGSRDPSFGSGGAVVVPDLGNNRIATNPSVAIDSSGRALLLVYKRLTRLNEDGSLDGSFGRNGTANVGSAGQVNRNDYASVAVLPDGTIVLAGSYSSIILRALSPSGADLKSFGIRGFSTVYPDFQASRVDLLNGPAGKLTVVGTAAPATAFTARFLTTAGPDDLDADGTPDAADRCPGRFARDAGCPKYGGTLTLDRLKGSRLLVRIDRSTEDGCREYRKVRLFRRSPGRDDLLLAQKTSGRGTVTFGPLLLYHGVYAVATRTFEPSFGICTSAHSQSVRGKTN